jgi:hypothetical protein
MPPDSHRRVAEFCRDRAREQFRAAISYGADDWEVVSLREDLRTADLRRALPRLHRLVLERDDVVPASEYPALGETVATTEVHEDAVVLHFPDGDRSGLVVTLDREAGQKLVGFLEACTDILRED